jgi:hypothetical protein
MRQRSTDRVKCGEDAGQLSVRQSRVEIPRKRHAAAEHKELCIVVWEEVCVDASGIKMRLGSAPLS